MLYCEPVLSDAVAAAALWRGAVRSRMVHPWVVATAAAMMVAVAVAVVSAAGPADSSSVRELHKSTELIKCKFSNEGCEANTECCSHKCLQAHPGTNARCTRSTLNDSCLYNYQCEERLVCGERNRCCSKYWGTCSRREDCCLPEHHCLEAEGFYYRRCLLPSGSALPFRRWGHGVGLALLLLAARWLLREVVIGDDLVVVL